MYLLPDPRKYLLHFVIDLLCSVLVSMMILMFVFLFLCLTFCSFFVCYNHIHSGGTSIKSHKRILKDAHWFWRKSEESGVEWNGKIKKKPSNGSMRWMDGWLDEIFIYTILDFSSRSNFSIFIYMYSLTVYIHRKANSSGKSYNQQMNRIDR